MWIYIILIAVLLLILVMAPTAAENFALVNQRINHTRRVRLHTVKWCPHCKNMLPIWEQVQRVTQGSNIIFEKIDEDIAKTPGITGYPTILMTDENGNVSRYSGEPDFDKLRNWIITPVRAPMPV